jgi:Flp pilus assembly pilin Flp
VIDMALPTRLAAVVMALLTKLETGQTLVEYSLMLALLAMAAVTTVSVVGVDVRELFTSVETQFRNASTP